MSVHGAAFRTPDSMFVFIKACRGVLFLRPPNAESSKNVLGETGGSVCRKTPERNRAGFLHTRPVYR